jgi:hypothetical protein
MNKNLFIAFSIGFTSGMGTMMYIGNAFHRSDHPDNLHPEILLLIAPLILGFANVFNVYFENKFSVPLGIVVAILFSTVGITIGLPETIFNITPIKARIFAIVYYTLLFWILTKINNFII